MDITEVFPLRPFVIVAALPSARNEQLLKSRLVISVPSINAFTVACKRAGVKSKD
jgi:hypothetical protein